MVLTGYMELILIDIFLYSMIMIFLINSLTHAKKIFTQQFYPQPSFLTFVHYYNYTDDKRKWLILFWSSFILILLQYIIKHIIFIFYTQEYLKIKYIVRQVFIL